MANKPQTAGSTESTHSAITSDYQRLTLAYLIKNGPATERNLIEWVAQQITSGPLSDDDRVRTAVNLRVHHFPELEEAGYIRRDGRELQADFLPPEIYDKAQSVLTE